MSYSSLLDKEKIDTSVGSITVGVVGDRKKPAIITYHDLGLNGYFPFKQGFVDITPGMDTQNYPTMEELAQMLASVADYFSIKSFIGLGVGAGANILCRYAIKNPKKVEALILINCVLSTCGWMEWGFQKMNVSYLRGKGMTSFTLDYLMWHHFGKNQDHYSPDLVMSYRQYFSKLANPANLAAFMESYIRRRPLPITRDGQTLQCPVLQIVGSGSPHIDGSIDFNSRLNPSQSNWLKVSDCSGLVLEEKPDKATEAILLFVQGLGYFPSMSHVKWVQTRQSSVVMDSPPLLPSQSPSRSPDPQPTSPDKEQKPREVAA